LIELIGRILKTRKFYMYLARS